MSSSDERDELIRGMREDGLSLREIGRAVGLSAVQGRRILTAGRNETARAGRRRCDEPAPPVPDLYRMCDLPGVDRDAVSALYRQVPPPTFAETAAILGVDAEAT